MKQVDLKQAGAAGAPPLAKELEWPVERVIVPAKRRLKIGDLVRHWAVIRVIAARDFKIKYKQSVLGPLWLVFQPLALLLAFIVAFRDLRTWRPPACPMSSSRSSASASGRSFRPR